MLKFELSTRVIRKPYLPHSRALERVSLWANIGGIWLSSWPGVSDFSRDRELSWRQWLSAELIHFTGAPSFGEARAALISKHLDLEDDGKWNGFDVELKL